MALKERVLIYECISGGGTGSMGTPPSPALLAQGMAMRDALAGDLARLGHLAVSCVATPWAPLPAGLASVAPVAPEAGAHPADFLAGAAGAYDRIWAIAPESGGLLADLAATVGEARWLGCTPAAIRLTASKSATRAWLATSGIAVPPAWWPGDRRPGPGGPWVVKPDDGVGAEDARLHPDFAAAARDLGERLAHGQASTLEAWVDGTPLSLSLLCAGGRAELLSINRQRIRARPGENLAYQGVDIDAEPVRSHRGRRLADLADCIAAAVPGLAGFVGVDLVWHPAAGPVVIEINPRLTCAYVGLSAALGRNLGGEILLALTPEARAHVLH